MEEYFQKLPAQAGASQPRRSAQRFPRDGCLKGLAVIVPAVLSLAANIITPRLFIDDAYITFRYAENLARGWGMVFNQGEAVLGTTSPLFALVLAGFKLSGIDVLESARWLGVFSFPGALVFLQLIAVRDVSPLYSLGIGLAAAVTPMLPITANLGMETGLYCFMVFATLYLSLAGSHLVAGVPAGLAALLRPDGAIVVMIAVVMAFRQRKKSALCTLAGAAVTVAPWLIYATWVFGSPLPHSIAAKRVFDAGSPLGSVRWTILMFAVSLPLATVSAFALGGGWLIIKRRSPLIAILVWAAIYLAGVLFSGIDPSPFIWYYTPLYPILTLLAGVCLERIALWAGSKTRGRAPVWKLLPAAPIILLLILTIGLGRSIGDFHDLVWRFSGERVQKYLQIGDRLHERCKPGQVVLVAELGALGYKLRDQKVIDGKGLVSPLAVRLAEEERQRREQEGLPPINVSQSTGWLMKFLVIAPPII